MEFNEKLQELRKNKSLTQEELAKELFVSRTAVSKWESGRGYPSIDSLKEISKFFSVTIDELICSQEFMTAAEKDKKETLSKYTSLICGSLDIFHVILFFTPIFGNGVNSQATVLFELNGISHWIKIVFAVMTGMTILNGIFAVILNNFDKPLWNRYILMTGICFSIVVSAIFILTKQPYAGMICFTALVIKAFFLFKEIKQ